ncbi:MAG: helix-turn-helix domain-containing protein [Candidatus Paceibacterota bacterium]
MANVSKKRLSPSTQKRLHTHFVRSIVSLETRTGGEKFLAELLSPTEYLILAKRLLIVLLLSEGMSQYKIRKLLNTSSSTVFKISNDAESGKYRHISKFCEKKHNRDHLFNDLEVILRAGLPELGRGRWKWLNEMYEK